MKEVNTKIPKIVKPKRVKTLQSRMDKIVLKPGRLTLAEYLNEITRDFTEFRWCVLNISQELIDEDLKNGKIRGY